MRAKRLQTGASTQLYFQTLNLPQKKFTAYERCGEDFRALNSVRQKTADINPTGTGQYLTNKSGKT